MRWGEKGNGGGLIVGLENEGSIGLFIYFLFSKTYYKFVCKICSYPIIAEKNKIVPQ